MTIIEGFITFILIPAAAYCIGVMVGIEKAKNGNVKGYKRY